MSEELPGGINEEELAAMRRLQRELAADGYRVGKVALTAGGEPVALTYLGKAGDPIRRIVIAARSILRNVAEVPVPFEVTAEEYETIQALRATARTLAHTAEVSPLPKTVDGLARVRFGQQARRGADLED
jgi:hypothetical protein